MVRRNQKQRPDVAGLTLRGYARHRGCQLRAVQKAIETGRISTLPNGRIDPAVADPEWAANTDPAKQRTGKKVSAVAAGGGKIPPFQVSRAAKEAYAARTARLEFETKAKTLLVADDVRAAVSAMLSAFRSKCMIIADELSDKLAATSDPIQCRELVDAKIHAALSELAEWPARA